MFTETIGWKQFYCWKSCDLEIANDSVHCCELSNIVYLQRIIQAFSDKFISQMQPKIQVIGSTDKSIDELNASHLANKKQKEQFNAAIFSYS